jgi:uncharacterized protein
MVLRAKISERIPRSLPSPRHRDRATPSLGSSCTLAVKAIPHAPRNEIAGWLGEALKVKIRAPALEGRANDALGEFLAERLDLPRRAVVLIQGEKSRQKLVRIAGLDLAEVKRRLGG